MSGVLTIEGVTLAIDGLRHMRIPMLTATVVLSTVACSSEAPTSVVKQATFSYTCCASADIDRVYHPGDVMTVHWIVQNEAPTSATQSTQIDLSAKLSGPYADVSSLKQREIGATSIAAATSISAAPIVTSDWAGGAPTSKAAHPRHRSAWVLQLVNDSEVRRVYRRGRRHRARRGPRAHLTDY